MLPCLLPAPRCYYATPRDLLLAAAMFAAIFLPPYADFDADTLRAASFRY